jgi:hypothetical protein
VKPLQPHDQATVMDLVKFAVKVVFAAYVYVGAIDLVHWLAR